MKKFTLAPFTFILVGIVFFVVITAYGLILNKIPNDAETELYNTNLSLLQAEANKQKAADKRVADAVALIKQKDLTWSSIVATRTPPDSLGAGGINLAVNEFQLTEDTRKFRNSIQRAVNEQIRKGGVTVVNGPLVPLIDPNAPAKSLLSSFYNYPAIPYPVVIFDLGTITVQGTYDQILRHVRDYKNMPHYLAVTDGLRLDGTSPNLTGTYNLSIVGFLKGKTIFTDVPEGASSASNTFGGGIGPGGPRGFGPAMGGGPPTGAGPPAGMIPPGAVGRGGGGGNPMAGAGAP